MIPYAPGSYVARGAKWLVRADKWERTGAWAFGFAKRGEVIEKALGGMCNNFPVIDKFVSNDKNIAKSITSIKSMDITLKSYKKSNHIYNTIMNYSNQLKKFDSRTWSGITVKVDNKTQRFLEIALPPIELTWDQANQVKRAVADAKKHGIDVKVIFFKG